MIAANVLRELQELDNLDLERACARFIHAALMVAVANDPRSANGPGSTHSGKPGSRPPGRQQCAWAVSRLCRMSQDAENVMSSAIATCAERDAHSEQVKTVGGIPVIDGEDGEDVIHVTARNGKLVGRRGNGTFASDPGAVRKRLADAVRQGASQ